MAALGKYIRKHWLISLVATYMFISCMIKLLTSFDMTIPCLIKTIFGYRCLGCGLTTAFIHLIQLDFSSAWKSNPLIFIVLPGLVTLVIYDFLKFRRRISGASLQ